MPENFGFAEGYNQAIRTIPCKYALLLNSDVEVSEGWLEPLYQCLKQQPKVAACQPKLLSYNEPRKFEYAGAAGGFLDTYGYPFCRGRIFDEMENDGGQYDDEIEIFWATGACMLISRDLFLKSGGFDGDFFAHMEEVDLCWRLKNMGYSVKYIPRSIVYHVGGGTLDAQNPQKTFLNFRNNRLMIFKNADSSQILKINIIRNLLDLTAILMALIRFRFAEAWAIVRAQIAYRKWLGRYIHKRSRIADIADQIRIGPPNTKGRYPKSIVFTYFVNRRKKFSQLSW